MNIARRCDEQTIANKNAQLASNAISLGNTPLLDGYMIL
jgi:hypothetical protein